MVRLPFILLSLLLFGNGCEIPGAVENTNKSEQTQSEAIKEKEDRVVLATKIIGDEFDSPVAIRHAGDDSGRLFVVEQTGKIIVLHNATDKAESSTFLDLTDTIYKQGWEQGLLGLAFHPEYAENGKLYVNYTTETSTVIAEYTRSKADRNKADPQSERRLIEFKQPYSNHNGGELAFGPDGYLYIASGDGGSGGDPHGHGQNLQSWLGKILRIDVNKTEGTKGYSIPLDNPFVGNDQGNFEEIYAYGLRNPWRFSFDSATGLLYAADVGQNKLEEINIIHNGGNYGWNTMEGSSCYKPSNNCDRTGLTMPIYEYKPDSRASITGGYVYRGNEIAALQGKYIFADFIDGRMWALTYEADQAEGTAIELDLNQPSITSFGTDEAGEIYICLHNGTILRLIEGS